MAVELSADVREAVSPYLAIMRDFLDGQVDAVGFEEAFNTRYLADDFMWPDEVFEQLDAVFSVAEEFECDPVSRAALVGAAGPAEMHQVITSAFARLNAMLATP